MHLGISFKIPEFNWSALLICYSTLEGLILSYVVTDKTLTHTPYQNVFITIVLIAWLHGCCFLLYTHFEINDRIMARLIFMGLIFSNFIVCT